MKSAAGYEKKKDNHPVKLQEATCGELLKVLCGCLMIQMIRIVGMLFSFKYSFFFFLGIFLIYGNVCRQVRVYCQYAYKSTYMRTHLQTFVFSYIKRAFLAALVLICLAALYCQLTFGHIAWPCQLSGLWIAPLTVELELELANMHTTSHQQQQL